MPPAIQRGDPGALALGPGYLYTAGLLTSGGVPTPEPTDLVTAWEDVDPGWVLLGYTETGSEFNYALTSGNVEVAEELDPVMISTTGRTSTVTFTLAEMTAANLGMAMNGGIIHYPADPNVEPPYDTYSDDVVIVEPPDLGSELRVMMGFESEDHTERWVMRQCFQTGTMKIIRQKGTVIAGIAAVFSLEKPVTGKRLFAAIMNVNPAFGANRLGWARPPSAAPLAPTVTGVTPNTGVAGDTVTISGTNLGGVTGAAFGAAPATNIAPGTAAGFDADVPAGTAGAAVAVTATTPAGTSTPLAAGFTYNP
jgi:IPT/TIG domain